MAPTKPPLPLASPDDIEQQFYDALQRGDIELLMSVWLDDEDIFSVHPGGPRVVGATAIRSAFETLFANGRVNAHPENIRRLNTHACAVHSVVEHLRILTGEGLQSVWVLATNVYVKTAQGWRLASHHASPASQHEVQERAEAGAVLH